jgi:phenylalanyl-tRNA synthetase beta subunit
MARGRKKAQGLGDTIEQITEVTGIKSVVEKFVKATGVDCNCDKRKETLNRLFPYHKPNCLVEEDYNYLTEFFGRLKDQVSVNDQYKLIDVYFRIFNIKVDKSNCGSCWRDRIAELRKVYNEYKVDVQ